MLIFLSLITYIFAQETRIYVPPGNFSFNETVPSGMCSMELEVRGGKGGNGNNGSPVPGGNGGLVSAIFSVNGGDNYDGRVGADGDSADFVAGGGGGSSGIRLNNNLLVLAGGGGGGGYSTSGIGGAGGGKGGFPSPTNGTNGNGGRGGSSGGAGGTNGLGGTADEGSGGGGANSDGTTPLGGGKSHGNGGNGGISSTSGGNGYTGGGGGGEFGGGGGGGFGGGGGGNDLGSGGGGGGGNFINITYRYISFSHNGSTNNSSPNNGEIKITFFPCSSPTPSINITKNNTYIDLPPSGASPNDYIFYVICIQNTGGVNLFNLNVTDNLFNITFPSTLNVSQTICQNYNMSIAPYL